MRLGLLWISRALGLTCFHQVREVDPSALAFVSKFSKLTGDFSRLSNTDLKVMALTYQLEKEFYGTSHLNEAPKPVSCRGEDVMG